MMEYVRSTSLLAPPPAGCGLPHPAGCGLSSAPSFSSASAPSFSSASAPSFSSGPNEEIATTNHNLDHLEASTRFSFVDPVTAIIFQDASHQNSHSSAPAVFPPPLLPDPPLPPLPHSHISSGSTTGAAAADPCSLDGDSPRLILRNVQSLAGTQSSSKKLMNYRYTLT